MNPQSKPSDILSNRSMPPGIIIPEMVYDDLDSAVTWLGEAFGFKERLRIRDHRSQLTLGAASIIIKTSPSRSKIGLSDPDPTKPLDREADHSIMVHIDDLDEHFEHAVLHGALVIHPPTDYPFGERQYTVEDIGGHIWTFSQTIANVDPGTWGGVLKSTGEGVD
jgi:uncharacterized glyoxalase superfamily protein PhnB